MKKFFRNKLVILTLMFVLFVLLGEASSSVALTNRAIVLGIAIDKCEEGIKVSAQILTGANASDDTTTSNNYVISYGKGRTIEEAVSNIGLNSASYVSFAHCNVILVSENYFADGNIFNEVDYLFKNSKIKENTSVICTKGEASEMLEKEVAISDISSFGIQKQLIANSYYSKIFFCDMRTYLVGYYNDNPNICMCYLTIEEEVEEGASKSQDDKKITFNLERVVNLDGNGVKKVMTTEESMYYCFVEKNFNEGSYTLRDGTGHTDFFFRKKSVKISPVLGDVPSVKMEFEASFNVNNDKLDVFSKPESGRTELVRDSIKSGITSLFEEFRELDVDIFKLYTKFYKKYGKKFKERYPDVPSFLAELEFSVEPKIELFN